MSIDTREAARDILTSATQDIGSGEIADFLWGITDDGSLSAEKKSAVVKEVRDLIRQTAVTVTLPGDEVCTGCGGTGQPGEDDGTPKDLPQWEDLRALLAELGDKLSDDELADQIMALFGGEAK